MGEFSSWGQNRETNYFSYKRESYVTVKSKILRNKTVCVTSNDITSFVSR